MDSQIVNCIVCKKKDGGWIAGFLAPKMSEIESCGWYETSQEGKTKQEAITKFGEETLKPLFQDAIENETSLEDLTQSPYEISEIDVVAFVVFTETTVRKKAQVSYRSSK
jgi:hypothetical protein